MFITILTYKMESGENKVEETKKNQMLGNKTIRDEDIIVIENPKDKKYGRNGMVFKIEDTELKKIQVSKSVYFRLLATQDDTLVDIRKFYKGYPTKQGVRFSFGLFKKLLEIIQEDLGDYK